MKPAADNAATSPRSAAGRPRGFVKICGLTSATDAALAASAGADALGFVFARSPRQLSIDQAAQITAQLPPAPLRVGVFVDAAAGTLLDAARRARLDVLQLHGDEPLELARSLAGAGVALWKALPMFPDGQDQATCQRLLAWAPWVDAFLLDTAVAGQSGGTGKTFDWHRVPALAEFLRREAGVDLPILVAGGLRPENIAQAIQASAAWGIDVSSGVEVTPGRKHPDRLRWLVQAARSTFALPPASPGEAPATAFLKD